METVERHFLKSCLVILITSFSIFIGCKKEAVLPVSPTLNYFPDQKGIWIDYAVDSIYHADNDNNNDDSVYSYHYFVRELTDSTFIDGEGRTNRIIERFKRQTETDEWILTDVWTQVITTNGAYRTENNVTYQKLAFPINRATTWNGNAMNSLTEETYEYADLHQPYSVGSMAFDSTLSVIQANENNYIETIYGKEVYASGLGLIYKEREDLEKRLGIVVKGLEFKMTMKNYGK